MPAEASSAVVGERKKQYTVVRVSRNGAPAPDHKGVQTQKGSKLAPVNSRVKGNSNKSKNRDATSHWWQVTKYRSTDKCAAQRARRKGRDTEETHSLKRHGGSKFRSKANRNSLVTRLLQICWNSHGEGDRVTRIVDVSTLK